MAWRNYIVKTTEMTIRTYRVKAQSPWHARDRLIRDGKDDDMLRISPGEEEVVTVYEEEEDG